MESDSLIEQAITTLRQQLKLAAQEEIQLMIQQFRTQLEDKTEK